MLHVGNTDKHENSEKSSKAIVSIFEGARKHSMDQHIVEKALEAFMRVSEVKQVTISNNVFTNNPDPVALSHEDEEDSDANY